ncbi:hypothetical protein [Salipiger thiooxidans]|uniref:hypothetical protein n=1 Tax=Salipiger thiooxidans TaxID=282683 RepID=UPI001CFAE331|nr:hypothetical protein [Salipiger thiooxidans]
MRFLLFSAALIGSAASAETMPWEHGAALYQPKSMTAVRDTGPIVISGSEVTFDQKAVAALDEVDWAWRDWNGDGTKETAKVYRISGGTFCDGEAVFVAFYSTAYGFGVSAFRGSSVPHDVHSDGLCATYSYDPSW